MRHSCRSRLPLSIVERAEIQSYIGIHPGLQAHQNSFAVAISPDALTPAAIDGEACSFDRFFALVPYAVHVIINKYLGSDRTFGPMTDKKQRPQFSLKARDQAVRMVGSDAELEKAIRSIARLIDRYGDAYWPLFERLEAELKERNSRKDRVTAYLPTSESALIQSDRPNKAKRFSE